MGMEMEHIASEMTDRQMNLMRTWRSGGQRRSVCHNGRIWEGSAVSSATVILSVNGRSDARQCVSTSRMGSNTRGLETNNRFGAL